MHEVSSVPAPRTPLHLEVAYKKNYARSENMGYIKNISLTGAFLHTTGGEFKPRERLQVKLVVGDRERLVPALVVWSNSNGCGIKFIPNNNRDVQIVDDLIYFAENKRETYRDMFGYLLKNVA